MYLGSRLGRKMLKALQHRYGQPDQTATGRHHKQDDGKSNPPKKESDFIPVAWLVPAAVVALFAWAAYYIVEGAYLPAYSACRKDSAKSIDECNALGLAAQGEFSTITWWCFVIVAVALFAIAVHLLDPKWQPQKYRKYVIGVAIAGGAVFVFWLFALTGYVIF